MLRSFSTGGGWFLKENSNTEASRHFHYDPQKYVWKGKDMLEKKERSSKKTISAWMLTRSKDFLSLMELYICNYYSIYDIAHTYLSWMFIEYLILYNHLYSRLSIEKWISRLYISKPLSWETNFVFFSPGLYDENNCWKISTAC